MAKPERRPQLPDVIVGAAAERRSVERSSQWAFRDAKDYVEIHSGERATPHGVELGLLTT